MAHKYMSYTRDESGRITRNHQVVLASDADVRIYDARETLWGWPEPYVFWCLLADGSAVGIAPMTQRVLRGLTHYHSIDARGPRSSNAALVAPSCYEGHSQTLP